MKSYFFTLILMMGLFCGAIMSSSKGTWKSNYHKHSEAQFQMGKRACDALQLEGNEKILDVGCGTGRTTHYFAQQFPNAQLVGVDLSTDMIEFARTEFADQKNLSFQVHDAIALPYENEFDLVVSFFCLHWVDDKEQAVAQIYKALKKGGRAILYISIGGDIYRTWRECVDRVVQDRPEWRALVADDGRMRSAETWQYFAQEAGFKVDASNVVENPRIYQTKESFKDHVMSLAIADMSEKEKKQYVDATVDELYRTLGLGDTDPFNFSPAVLSLTLTK